MNAALLLISAALMIYWSYLGMAEMWKHLSVDHNVQVCVIAAVPSFFVVLQTSMQKAWVAVASPF